MDLITLIGRAARSIIWSGFAPRRSSGASFRRQGRRTVQFVALLLIVDREREIEIFLPQE